MNIILKKSKENFSYIRYFMFIYLKKYRVYEKNIKNDILFIPYKKRLNSRYLKALVEFLRSKNTEKFMTFDEDIKNEFKKYFSVIYGKNIYNTIFYDILNFMSKNKLYEYEIIFISDNIKEIKNLIDKCVKNVKAISVFTQKPHLYESMQDYTISKYGVLLNIKTKKDKIKKHNKIYVNCGHSEVFDKGMFKNVNLLDIYNVYENSFSSIILESTAKEKEYTKVLECPYSLALAEFLYGNESDKKYKIVNIKK